MLACKMTGVGTRYVFVRWIGAATGSLLGLTATTAAWILSSGVTLLLVPGVTHADNGQCVWEGGSGAPTYQYCNLEDCIGSGGRAQCTEPITIAPEPNVDGQNNAYGMCDDTASYTYDWQQWCLVEGGSFSVNTGCTGIPPPYNPDLSAGTEGAAVAASDAFEGAAPCNGTLASDTGWGYTNTQDQYCAISTTTQNGYIVSEGRKLTYSRPQSCGVLASVVILQRYTALGCHPGDYERTLPSGFIQCVKPACACTVGDPVNAVTGAEVQQFTDYKAGGIGGLEFGRYYNSGGGYRYPGGGPYTPIFSDYWQFSYQRHLTPITGNSAVTAVLQREGGTIEEFDGAGNEILNRTGAADKLQSNGNSGWTLTRGDGATEVYDANGNLLSVTQLNGLTISLTYSNGAISAIADSFGHTLNLSYNEGGQLTTVTLPDGSSTISYGYGTIGQLTNVVYSDNTSVSYSYQVPKNPWLLSGIEDESAQQYATYTYSPSGTIASEEQGNGVQQYTYAIYAATPGGPTTASVTDPLNQTRAFSYTDANGVYKPNSSQIYCSDCDNVQNEIYDANGNPQSVTDLDGHETLYTYDETRNLEVSRTEGLLDGQTTSATRTITTQWHATLRLPVVISVYAGASAAGTPLRTTSFTYDSYGNALNKTITDGATDSTRTWTYTYFNGGQDGQLESVDGPRTDVSDVTNYTYYDCATGGDCGRIHTITDALGHVTTYDSYDANGLPLEITDPNGTITAMTYDKRQRLTTRTVGGENTQFAYYPTGLLQRATMPDGSYLSYLYDTAHRLTEVDDSLGDRLVYTLDAAGNHQLTQIYDPSGNLVRASGDLYNSLGELWQQLTSAATTATATVYGYDAQGNITSTAAPLGRTIGETYDTLNRVQTVTDPASGVTRYSYDADDNPVAVTDPRTLTTSYSYDGFGDLTQLQSPDSGLTQFTYDSAGDLATSLDGRGTKATYSYDALDRVTQITYPDQTVSLTYDQGSNGIDRLSNVSDGTGQTAFSYDALGRVTQEAATVGGTKLAVSYAYQNGDLSTLTTPSGQVLAYAYNQNGQISSMTLNGSTLLSSIQYSPFGPISGWTWGNGTQTGRDYDLDGHTTEIDSGGVSNYTYNDDGTVNSRSDDTEADYSVVSGTTSVSISAANNQIAGTSGALVRAYSYDGAGNTLGTGSATFTYNGANRLASVTESGATVTFGVNALGQRVSKTSSTGSVLFAYDEQGHLIGEYGPTGSLIEETVWLGDIPVATIRPDSNGGGVDVYYVHTDQSDTPRRVTRSSDNTVIWRWSSDPYGTGFVDEDPEGSGDLFVYNLRFPGQYYDSETGLVYNYRRDYDPQLGRYVESDPIGLAGGSYSTYSYTSDNPISRIDPDGLQEVLPIPWWEFLNPAVESSSETGGVPTTVDEGVPDVSTPGNPNDCDPCRGLREQLQAHEQKLQEYLNNPLDADLMSQGRIWMDILFRNGANVESILRGRVRNLEKQIATFKRDLEECEIKHGA